MFEKKERDMYIEKVRDKGVYRKREGVGVSEREREEKRDGKTESLEREIERNRGKAIVSGIYLPVVK